MPLRKAQRVFSIGSTVAKMVMKCWQKLSLGVDEGWEPVARFSKIPSVEKTLYRSPIVPVQKKICFSGGFFTYYHSAIPECCLFEIAPSAGPAYTRRPQRHAYPKVRAMKLFIA